jgi:hypothetical protein
MADWLRGCRGLILQASVPWLYNLYTKCGALLLRFVGIKGGISHIDGAIVSAGVKDIQP